MNKSGMEEDVMLSVIVILFNSEKSLPALLSDIKQFAADDIELLLIDDGSTDESAELCACYAPQNNRVRFVRQENAGPSAARNNGLKNAIGRYVVFFDSDDRVDPAAFSSLLAQLRGKPEADIWCSDFYWVDQDNVVFDRVFQIRETETPIRTPGYLQEYLNAPGCYWNVWRYVFRREFLLEHDLLFPEGWHCAEDMDFITRCFLAEPHCSFYHNPYYHYVISRSSLSHRLTAERMRHTAEMLGKSLQLVRVSNQTPGAKQMEKKLLREYAIHLSMLYDVPRRERSEAKEAFSQQLWRLKTAEDGKYRLLYGGTQVLGLSTIARISCAARHAWRLPRRLMRVVNNRGRLA